MPAPSVALALQGGGSHGAFTWGVLDRLLQEAEAGRLHIAAVSGASAGALNASVLAAGLAEGGSAAARRRLSAFWRLVAGQGAAAGNPFFGYAEPGPFGWNIDWSPAAIMLEAVGLVASPYNNPFYRDPMAPLLAAAFPGDELARLNQAAGPRLFLSALNVATNARKLFTQPHISADALRASCCLPTEFRTVEIGGTPYWDGGYIGNPPLAPLVKHATDVLLVMANPLHRKDMPPRNARAILSRLNEVTFNASVVLEINAIEAINRLLQDVRKQGLEYSGRYRPVHLHLIRDDAFTAGLGMVSKNSTAWPLLSALHKAGVATADAWLAKHRDSLGQRSSEDVKATLTRPMLNGAAASPA